MRPLLPALVLLVSLFTPAAGAQSLLGTLRDTCDARVAPCGELLAPLVPQAQPPPAPVSDPAPDPETAAPDPSAEPSATPAAPAASPGTTSAPPASTPAPATEAAADAPAQQEAPDAGAPDEGTPEREREPAPPSARSVVATVGPLLAILLVILLAVGLLLPAFRDRRAVEPRFVARARTDAMQKDIDATLREMRGPRQPM